MTPDPRQQQIVQSARDLLTALEDPDRPGWFTIDSVPDGEFVRFGWRHVSSDIRGYCLNGKLIGAMVSLRGDDRDPPTHWRPE